MLINIKYQWEKLWCDFPVVTHSHSVEQLVNAFKRPCLLAPASGGKKSHKSAVDTDSVAIRATKQLVTLTSIEGFSAHCHPPGYGPVTYKPESGWKMQLVETQVG